jgi:hypothetical protein
MTPQRPARRSRNAGTTFFIIFGLIWTSISAVVFVFSLSSEELFPIAFSGCFVLIGLGFLAWGGFAIYSRYRVGRPELTISNTTLRVGEAFTVDLYHSFKRAVQVEKMQVQLIFRETATYQQGTDTRTVIHNEVVEDFNLPGGHFQSGHMIQDSFNMQIPPDGMHTLKVRRNKLEWFVKIQMVIPKLPDYTDEYELDVIPEQVAAPEASY